MPPMPESALRTSCGALHPPRKWGFRMGISSVVRDKCGSAPSVGATPGFALPSGAGVRARFTLAPS